MTTRANRITPFVWYATGLVEELMKAAPGKIKGQTPLKLVCVLAIKAGKLNGVCEKDVRALLGLIGANTQTAQIIADGCTNVYVKLPECPEFIVFLEPLIDRLTPDQELVAQAVYEYIEELPAMVNVPTNGRLRIAAIVLFIRLHGLTASKLDQRRLYSLFEQVVPGLADAPAFVCKSIRMYKLREVAAI